ncbi:hypothetical protein N8I74_06725 [Chitiniphilus purpureus]|uniref:Uncharacterized protein n=1 Tax=Chitiniphilus purpureus TaxID=2981137 RepID=A0ABY6DQQ6_9NEIS|nr:hypothetical protein [Chitiniphilus sp. CD1]UXY16710.1 hypothetical protein N8I74_06725 [Chitiniphilus sp. CD1]
MTQPQHHIAGDVGVVAHGSVTIHGGLQMSAAANQDQGDALIGAQRARLHALVAEIQALRGTSSEEDAQAAWQVMHRATGRKLADMTQALFAAGEAALLAEIEALTGERRRQSLLRLILTRTSEDAGLKQSAAGYALRHYGTGYFKDLDFAQLQGVLTHLDALAQAPVTPDVCNACASHQERVTQLQRDNKALRAAARSIQDKRDREHEATATRLGEERDQLKAALATARQRETDLQLAHAAHLETVRGRWMVVAAMAGFGGVLIGAWWL